LFQNKDKKKVAADVLAEVQQERESIFLKSVLERHLKSLPKKEQLVGSILHEVRNEKDRDILNPMVMKPILERALEGVPAQQMLVSMILEGVQEKKSHGFVLPILQEMLASFKEQLADDLNISSALAALFDMVRKVNALCDEKKIGIREAEDVLEFLEKIDHILGVLPLKQEEEEIPSELISALKEREKARLEKDWKTADERRLFISQAGFIIEDTPTGARLKKSRSLHE
ncbi:MAG: hypothetical protein HYZ48_01880, partial [Chlamydiales bacterium]|nr:hypothetical protein [Chlamydiales bacterium]